MRASFRLVDEDDDSDDQDDLTDDIFDDLPCDSTVCEFITFSLPKQRLMICRPTRDRIHS